MQEAELRHIARARIEAGKLPCEFPAPTWGGHGSGELCELCNEPIGRYQIEYIVQLPGSTRAQRCPFHLGCYMAWRLECDESESPY
jgi:hypothetical protein